MYEDVILIREKIDSLMLMYKMVVGENSEYDYYIEHRSLKNHRNNKIQSKSIEESFIKDLKVLCEDYLFESITFNVSIPFQDANISFTLYKDEDNEQINSLTLISKNIANALAGESKITDQNSPLFLTFKDVYNFGIDVCLDSVFDIKNWMKKDGTS